MYLYMINMFVYSAVLLPSLKYNLMEKGLGSKMAVTVSHNNDSIYIKDP